MSNSLRVLMLEDSAADAELALLTLRRAGYDPIPDRVETERDFRASLRKVPQIILADFSMPEFDSLRALEIMQESRLDIPFIILSGTIGEERAVQVMQRGAADYVAKDRMGRLGQAVSNALERQESSCRLRESEARVRELTEHIEQVLWTIDAIEGRVLYVSPAYETLWGRSCRSVIDHPRSWMEGVHPLDQDAMLQEDAAMYREGHIDAEFRVLRPDGSIRWARIRGYPVRERDRLVRIVGVIEDITEARSVEEQLRQAKKMEAVGQLAGGIAHDFNNLLCAMSGYTELTLAQTPSESPVKHYLLQLRKAAESATLLTRRLLAFTRKQVVQVEVLDIGSVIRDVEHLLRSLIREDIALRLTLDPEAGNVLIDRSHVEQVVMNLVINARDAITSIGSISISTRAVSAATLTLPDPDVPAGDYVMLSVADEGEGMTPEAQVHLCEPFFTTKPEGQGTGLGLATVQGIVQQTRGHIRFRTGRGEGTTFRIYWPEVDGPASRARARRPVQALVEGTETILVVEDNAMIRGVVVDLLRGRGFRVLEAGDGPTALAKAGEHTGRIDALVSDVVMPYMRGPELADRLRETRPGLKVMLLSAYSKELAAGGDVERLGAVFVSKPFRLDEFLTKLRDLLGARATAASTGDAKQAW